MTRGGKRKGDGRPIGSMKAAFYDSDAFIHQQELITSCQLPVKGKEKLEEMGIEFSEPNVDDPLFCDAKLPAGWSKRPTDNPVWSELIDDQNNVKAMIFYKAEFYDRDAFIS